ncbi:MAG: hypothetical protein ABIN74_10905 [Ferruginibacter sp.]
MKKIIISLLVIVQYQVLTAQTGSVGIGTASPNPSAQLDVTSITKGLLIPRMTGAQRVAIATPVAGLLVYQTNTEVSPPSAIGFYLYDAGAWKRIASVNDISGSATWTVNGSNQYSNVSGSVGIGTTTPNAKSVLDLSSTTKGFLLPHMSAAQRTAISSPPGGLMVYDNDWGEVFEFDAGINKWKPVNFFFRPSIGNYILSAIDSIGISANVPKERLHVNQGSIYVSDNRNAAQLNPYVIFDVPGVDYKEAGIQFKRGTDTLASIKYVAHPTLSNFIQLKASQSGTGPSLYVTNNGTGIGTADPQAMFHIKKNDAEEMIRLDGLNPMIKFRKYVGLLNYDDIGFIQTVNDDLRIGTFSNNTLGDFIIRTGGTDNMIVDENGDVGIGPVTNPLTKLHILGGQDAGLSSSANGFMMMGFATAGASNLVIDNNEIMVRSGYSTAGNLTLQNNGGDLTIGARTTINKGGEALKLDGDDPAINLYDNGVQKGYVWQTGNNLQIGTSDALGKVIINTNKMQISTSVNLPDGYRLGVGGKILCEELKVKLQSAGWPDYVFDNRYKLPALNEVEKFIQINKHLPNIPSAAEVEKDGIEVGNMQKRMMEKIEELTLYIIQQQKEIEVLKTQMKKAN